MEGDYARVVLEGRVTYAGDGWVTLEGDHGFYATEPKGLVSVTKLSPPLPTTPGSVILEGRVVFYLTSVGWRTIGPASGTYQPEVFTRLDNVTILHDAATID